MEMESLSTQLKKYVYTRNISLNTDYTDTSWVGHNKHLPVPHGLILSPLLWWIAKRATINHVFASPAEWILTPLLARLENTVLTICKDNPEINKLEGNLDTLKGLRCIVVESERHREFLVQGGVDEDKIRLIYPGVDSKPYSKAPEPFTIMFATSPKSKNAFLARGIHLMIRVAERLPQVQFRFIWREWQHNKLQNLIDNSSASNINVINKYVPNMQDMYNSAHAVILPALTETSLKPCPHSGLHSLAHGKPVLVSSYLSMSRIVKQSQCGVVFEPTVESLSMAIQRLKNEYKHYQKNTYSAVKNYFSYSSFISKYKDVYFSIFKDIG